MKTKWYLVVLLVLVLVLAVGTAVFSQTSSSYNLSWHVIGSGGAASSASYRLNGTMGQGAASPAQAASAHYKISSGYWQAGWQIFLPVTLRE